MKLVILGATGGTGLCLIEEALSAGHEVIALVRTPDKIKTINGNLRVIKVDLSDSKQIIENISGCDAILSSVGGRPGMFTPCSVYTSIGKAAISAMRESEIKRFICVTAWGTKDDPNLPYIWRWVLKPSLLRNVVKNMEDFEDYLIGECADINYTIVKPPRLLNTPSTGRKMEVCEGQYVKDYKSHSVSRRDLAKFVLECLATTDYDRKMVAVNCP